MNNLKNFYKNKNILVTGGAGFIGSNICNELIKLNANVTIVDNFSTGNLLNLKNILNKIKIIHGDITNFLTCKRVTTDQNIVFHLAAFVSVPNSIINPSLCYKINIDGTKNLLKASKKNKVSKFIFSSSSSVYGNRSDKCSEEDKPNPQSPYAKSKLAGETLCKEYSQKYKIKTAILRYFNVYGDNQNPNGEYAAVVAKFKNNLIHKIPITIFGNGKQTRDFIHIDKVVKANLIIAMQKKIYGDIVNIATGKSINLLELIKILEKETNFKNVGLNFKPARQKDILNSYANCTKYKKIISQSY